MPSELILITTTGKKSHLLDLVTRITEGYKQKYVTGGGQTGATSLRVLIYEREGGTKDNLIQSITLKDPSVDITCPVSLLSTYPFRQFLSSLNILDISHDFSTCLVSKNISAHSLAFCRSNEDAKTTQKNGMELDS